MGIYLVDRAFAFARRSIGGNTRPPRPGGRLRTAHTPGGKNMAWEAFVDQRGNSYEVNWDGVYRIIRAYVRSRAICNSTTTRVEKHWVGPNIYSVDVDWAGVRQRTEQDSRGLYGQFYVSALQSMPEQLRNLQSMALSTADCNDAVAQQVREASHMSMASISSSVRYLGWGESALKFLRDLSADALVIGAGVLSGGWALAALGAGSALKGGAKYEDSGSWEAGVFTASTELLFGALRVKIRLGNMAPDMQTLWTVVVLPKAKAALEVVSKTVVEGKSLQDGITSGVLKSSDPAVLFLFKQLAQPAAGTKGQFIWNGAALLAAAAVKVARDRGVQAAVDATHKKAPATSPPPPPAVNGSVVDAAVFTRDQVEQLAIRPRSF
jgi:hypothetical protein